MRNRVVGLALLSSLAATSSGCAAVFKGSSQTVHFDSVPGESDVNVDSRYAGATPVDAKISRSSASNIVVSKEGFKERYVPVQRHADTPWWFWDIGTCVVPITLCIPLLVDAISGAWYSYDDEIRVKLDPLPVITRSPTTAAPPALAPAAAIEP